MTQCSSGNCGASTKPGAMDEQDAAVQDSLGRIKHKFIVMSGKGGVGKTSTSVNLAMALANQKCQVGIMDVDLHGPDVPRMLGLNGMLDLSKNRKLNPFCKTVNMEIFGLIENMSGFACPHCGEALDLFGSGGGEKTAESMGVPFLGRIPFDMRLVSCGDAGMSFRDNHADAPVSKAFDEIAQKMATLI